MRNLFLFLWRYNFFILFLAVESVCFYLIFSNRSFHHAGFLNSANTVTAEVDNTLHNLTEYINLKKTNEDLSRENARLHSLLPDMYYSDTLVQKIISDSTYSQQYTFLSAKVINNSVNRRNNFLTLDRGSLQGVKPEMGVVSSEGLVGIVKDVSEHYCSVMSFLHKDSRISAKFKKSNYIGSLVWDGYDATHATLKDIARHVQIVRGDTLITSSFSSIFPEGIMLGTVDDFKAKAGDNFYNIDVKISTGFDKLAYVYIVNNVFKGEQIKLEEKENNGR